ncbi:hypothetical protein F5887DRAFT_914550 [Amanita rubescens]|nr:hypothetical protein F5887DRAFT_918916 [Amanita rubescens]KAF8344381.1 hypothetical protein F5887DRAFT_1204789 [Amanita rubescens]KAF8349634.1 hypothetical protein F5887DRAFT_914550 [Amanita rubescens]
MSRSVRPCSTHVPEQPDLVQTVKERYQYESPRSPSPPSLPSRAPTPQTVMIMDSIRPRSTHVQQQSHLAKPGRLEHLVPRCFQLRTAGGDELDEELGDDLSQHGKADSDDEIDEKFGDNDTASSTRNSDLCTNEPHHFSRCIGSNLAAPFFLSSVSPTFVDGQEAKSATGCSEGLFFSLPLLLLKDVLEEWRIWHKVDDDPQMGANSKLKEAIQSFPPDWVRCEYSQRGWIPIIADKYEVGIDLARELGRGENSDDSEDDLDYEIYFYDSDDCGKGDWGCDNGAGVVLVATGTPGGEYQPIM